MYDDNKAEKQYQTYHTIPRCKWGAPHNGSLYIQTGIPLSEPAYMCVLNEQGIMIEESV